MAVPLHGDKGQVKATEQMVDQVLNWIDAVQGVGLPRIVITREKDKEPVYDSGSDDPDKQKLDAKTVKDVAKLRRIPEGTQVEGVKDLKVQVDTRVVLQSENGKVTINQQVNFELTVKPERARSEERTKPGKQQGNPPDRAQQPKQAEPEKQQGNPPNRAQSPAQSGEKPPLKKRTPEERTQTLIKKMQDYAKKAGKSVGTKGKVYNWTASPNGDINIQKNGKPVLTHKEGKTDSQLTPGDISHFEKALAKTQNRSKGMAR